MKPESVSRNYDRAAAYYDRLTGLAFQKLLRVEDRCRRRTVNLLGDIAGKRVLDIGCGTGRNFPFLMPIIGENGQLVGLDYSRGMLEQAHHRVAKQRWRNVTLLQGDAAVLEVGEGLFDAIISTWCLGIVEDLDATLARMLTKVKPGGRIAIMDFQGARPEHGLLRWLYPFYSRLLQLAGIDTKEDLDDAKLRAKWALGRAFLANRLSDITEESYLQGLGFLMAGTVRGEPATTIR